MQLPLSTPALLFPAIAILMLGYINRYIAVAGVIRTFKKDYDTGYRHTDLVRQINILRSRIETLRYMITVAIIGLILACVSMFLLYTKHVSAGGIVFASSLICMIISMILSLRETSLSNKSLLIEIQSILDSEKSA